MRRAAGLVLLALALPAQAQYVPRSEVATAAQAAAVEAKAYTRPEALAVAIQQAWIESNVDALRAEARLQQLLLRLREAPAATAARAAVENLLDHSPRVYTDAVDPEHRNRTVPAFEIAGSARAVLRGWDDRAAQARYRDALARADLAALRDAANARVLAALIREADAAELALLLQAELPQGAARLALFERSADATLARDLLRDAADPATQGLAARIARRLPPGTAIEVLADADVHESRRSAARLAIGALVPAHEAARAHLLATLGDAHGASSAAALARDIDDATLQALDAMLDTRTDSARVRRALLALRLSGDARARALLRAYAEDAAQPAAVRDEVRTWLR